jgi:hypothetical protein
MSNTVTNAMSQPLGTESFMPPPAAEEEDRNDERESPRSDVPSRRTW